MSFDDLYNNFKIVKQEVKGTASSSSQNMAFVSSPNSTNEVNIAYEVSTANTQVSPASTQVSTTCTQVSTANLSDDTIYAFLASQPNGSQLVYEYLKQIHEDDIEEMDLKWQSALLSMRTRRFFQKTGRKIIINESDTAGYDKLKSYMADDEVPTNMALMAFSDSEVMVISVILVSSNSLEDSMGTPAGRVILFGTIPTTILDITPVITPPITQTDTIVIPTEILIIAPTIPPSPDYTPVSPDYSPTSDTDSDPSEDPSSDHIPPLPAILPFLSSVDDIIDSDTPDTPPTHGTPFTEITSSTQRSPVIPLRLVMILAPRQPIPYGRPYRYHLNGPVHMMTVRKKVGPLPVHQLAVRHSVDHSSSDHFSPDDSARDSSLDSSSEASSDFHSDALFDSSLRHSLLDHSSPDLPSTSAGPSRKRRRSPMTSVLALAPVSGALSPVHADLIPSPKRVRDSGYLADVEVDPRETSLRDDVIFRGSDEPHLEQDINLEVQAEIDECIAYTDALKDRGIDARVIVEAVDRVESKTGARGLVKVRVERVTHHLMPDDIPEPAQEGAVEVIEGVQREQGRRIVRVESAVTALTKRITELERDNMRLRGTTSVESQRVNRLQCDMSHIQRELRQIRRLRFYDRVRVGRFEAYARKYMGYRP
ncbi:hypothetical protein Tco_0572950 [Tanacetum coccineum]